MNSRKLPALARCLRWLGIVILVTALAGCHGGSSAQSNNSSTNGNSTTGNAVNNEGVLNQNSGTGG